MYWSSRSGFGKTNVSDPKLKFSYYFILIPKSLKLRGVTDYLNCVLSETADTKILLNIFHVFLLEKLVLCDFIDVHENCLPFWLIYIIT